MQPSACMQRRAKRLLAVLLLPLAAASAAHATTPAPQPDLARHPTAEQRATDESTIDLGDAYRVKQQRIHLRRRTDRVVVMLDPAAASDASLAALQVDGLRSIKTLGNGLHVLGIGPPGQLAKADARRELESGLQRLATAQGLAWHAPVFVTDQGRDVIVTDEVLVRLVDGASPAAVFADPRIARTRRADSSDAFVLTVAAGAGDAALALAAALSTDPRVVWAEPDILREIDFFGVPNDPLFPLQWHLANGGQAAGVEGADANLPAAWEQIPDGAAGRSIAIIDTGMDLSHPDLALFANPGEIAGNSIDDDGNGYVDDTRGWDFLTPGAGDPLPQAVDPDERHGTAVAGVAAARGNNGIGVAGAAFGAMILPIRIGNENIASDARVAAAIAFAAGRGRQPGDANWQGVDVINASWGIPGPSSALEEAVAWAAEHGRGGRGTPITIATGNGGGEGLSYPASLSGEFDNVIAVGASDNRDRRSAYSQYGAQIDLLAPSNGGTLSVTTTDRLGPDGYADGDYASTFGGTSSAAPLAAGVAALVIAAHPTLTAAGVRDLLRNTARKVGPLAYVDGFNPQYGYGRIDAAQAIDALGNTRAALAFGGSVLANGATVFVNRSAPFATTLQFTLSSAGTEPLLAGPVSLTGSDAFSIVAPLPSAPLGFGESAQFGVAFDGQHGGRYQATLSFTTNDPAQPTIDIPLDVLLAAASIEGTVFEDWNGNGTMDAGDPPLADRPVYLDLDDNGVQDGDTTTEAQSAPALGLQFGAMAAKVTSTIEVAGLAPQLGRVDVGVNIAHPFVGDMRVRLRGPNNVAVTLVDRPGAGQDAGADFTGTVFSDDSPLALAEGTAPYGTAYRPEQALSTFHGIDPNGAWHLEVTDFAPGSHDGTLINWSLVFTLPQDPQSTTDAEGHYRFTSLPDGAYVIRPATEDGWRVSGSDSEVVQVDAAHGPATVDFGLQKRDTLYGRVYLDDNANGMQDAGELPAEHAVVYIDGDGSGSLATAVHANFEQDALAAEIPDDSWFGAFLVAELGTGFEPSSLLDVDVEFDIHHPDVSELSLTLVTPDGTSILLADRNGAGPDFLGTSFDDDAALAIDEAYQPPHTGAFRPLQPLGTAIGGPALGQWWLLVQDWSLGNSGTVERWRLDATYSPEPFVLTDAFGNYALPASEVAQSIAVVPIADTRISQPASGVYALALAQGDTADGLDFGLAPNQPPQFEGTPYVFEIDATDLSGTVVGSISASDADGDPVTYAIVSSDVDDGFALNSTTGELSLLMPGASLPEDTSLELLVRATDPHGATSDTVVKLHIGATGTALFRDGFEH